MDKFHHITAATEAYALITKYGGSDVIGDKPDLAEGTYMAGILSYTTVFVAMVMLLEHGVLRPVERRVVRWRQDQP